MEEFRKKKNKVYLFFIFLSVFILGCSQEPNKYEESKFMLNTLITATVYDKDINKAKAAVKKAFLEMERIDRDINSHSKTGELYKLNNSNGKFIDLSDETLKLLKNGITISEETDGGYDITVAPLFEAWNFEQGENAILPNEKILKEKVKLVNYKNIIIEGNKAKLLGDGTKIEGGSFLKGYALSRAKETLLKEKIESAFISATSTIETIGTKTNGKKWRVGIQNPSNPEKFITIIELNGKSIGVAGDYQTYIEVNGKKYHHILNAKTGYPVLGIKMVVIIDEDGYRADLYDTAVFIAGVEKGTRLMKEKNLSGLIIDSEGKSHYIGEFEKYIASEE